MKASTKRVIENEDFQENSSSSENVFESSQKASLNTGKSSIRLLPQRLVNQIAAGEVIERPASVIKELVENAVDAGATEITVEIVDGGKNFISVADNGSGMDKDSLEICVLSHATSKLSSENLFDIHTFGFRGEALPSIASVSRLSITTANNDDGEACRLQMEGNELENISPANRSRGTTLEVKDLFFATPARLKFLKSDSYETERCRAIFDDIALANCSISFKFVDSNYEKAYYASTGDVLQRIKDIFGESFVKNIFELDGSSDKYEFSLYEGLSLRGYAGVPTFNRSTSNQQYFFVNGRLVKDKIIASALRSAYSGLIPHGRYPIAILFLEMPYKEVDVNVHPAKTEVRFKNPEKVRNFVVSELRRAIASQGSTRSTTEIMDRFYANAIEVPTGNKGGMRESFAAIRTTTAEEAATTVGRAVSSEITELEAARTAKTAISATLDDDAEASNFTGIFTFPSEYKPQKSSHSYSSSSSSFGYSPSLSSAQSSASRLPPSKNSFIADLSQIERENGIEYNEPKRSEPKYQDQPQPINSLGNAVFQVHNTYIVAESDEGIIIVDQHAAAERIMLEELKKNLKIASQNLLMPPSMKLGLAKVELLKTYDDFLKKLGVYIEYSKSEQDTSSNSNNNVPQKDLQKDSFEVTISAVPAILETSDVEQLINDMLDELASFGDAYTLDDKIHKVLSTISCHSSLRAGKKLSLQEMNYLLRKMELTTNIAQCCHGRPSYIKLSLKDLNIFFERS